MTEPIPRRSKISTLDLYLLVASIVELHKVTTLKILGHELSRYRQPLIGVSTDEYGQERLTGYQSRHSTQDTKVVGTTEGKVCCEESGSGQY